MHWLNWFVAGPLLYIAVLTFIVITGKKVLYYASMPRHLRWDLYPIPHLGTQGSKYQKVDFGKRAPHFSLVHELWEMSQEMLFIKKAFINNPRVWKGSFPLHAGIYLGMVWLVLIVCGAILGMMGTPVSREATGIVAVGVYYATIITGVTGAAFGLFGSISLLWMRYFDESMRDMADFLTYANLYLMTMVFASGLLAWWGVDPDYSLMRRHAGSLLTFSPSSPHPLLAFETFWFAVFLLYLPFSRMLHFVAKYFFYHDIMWDDEAMKPGSKLEQDVISYLHYELTWSAPHITPHGTWLEQVAAGRKEEENK